MREKLIEVALPLEAITGQAWQPHFFAASVNYNRDELLLVMSEEPG